MKDWAYVTTLPCVVQRHESTRVPGQVNSNFENVALLLNLLGTDGVRPVAGDVAGHNSWSSDAPGYG